MKVSAFESPATETEGKWFPALLNGEEIEGAELKIAGIKNPLYTRAWNDAVARLAEKAMGRGGQSAMANFRPSVAEQERIERELIARHILLDWRGLDTDDDKPLPYTEADAQRLLKNWRFKEMVLYYANDLAAFGEAERGNLPNSEGQTSE